MASSGVRITHGFAVPIGDSMKRINNDTFFQFGKALAPLASLQAGKKMSEVMFSVYGATNWLDWFLQDKVVPLNVCKGPGYALSRSLNDVTAILNQENADLTKPIEAQQVYEISNNLKNFETVLSAELQTSDTYFISQTGIYSTPDLIEKAERVFPESTRKHIPDHAIKDIRQAGKCLAFDLPTAAAFHMLRATEALIREYYGIVVGHLPRMQSRNWGRYISHLREHGADIKILAALDQIREMHRNPLMHPEDFLSADEAATLFGVVQGVIVSMAADIEKRKSPSLSLVKTVPQ